MKQSEQPMRFTRDNVRQVDQRAIEQYRIPGIILMENAARQLADLACVMLGQRTGPILICCGGGNNGGDGFAAARHLHNRGRQVILIQCKTDEQYTGDARINHTICQSMQLPIHVCTDQPEQTAASLPRPELIIDALLGTGLKSQVRPPISRLIQWINSQSAKTLAVDIPSGLDCDTGQPLGQAVRADATITFVGTKVGFHQPDAGQWTGAVHVADIGAPVELLQELAEEQ